MTSLRPLAKAALWLALVLLGLSFLDILQGDRGLSDVFFWRQDLAVLVVVTLAVALLGRVKLADAAAGFLFPSRPWPFVAGAALVVVLVSWAGVHVVHHDYPLSLDEFMARFDATVFAHGRMLGEIPQRWVDYRAALQPMFMVEPPSPAHWISSYLPVNAAFLALGGLVGLQTLVNPAWAAVAVLATYGCARRLWPDDRRAAFVAAMLVATSTQVLVTAMTPYAMTAHLALNMVWLLCFLRGGVAGHAGALATGFAATGLHQIVFHPLFAAPFVLQLWLDRRWRLAVIYTCAYALIGLAWIFYWEVGFSTIETVAAPTAAAAGGFTGGGFLHRVWSLIDRFNAEEIGLIAKNMVRFVSWQNPLTAPLALVGAAAAWRARGHLRALLLGVGLCLLAMLVLLPYQGHGWGYRYLHGFIGSAALLAAFGWSQLAGSASRPAQAVFLAFAAISILVLLPVRAWQAHAFVHPYAAAHRMIERAPADVVMVEDVDVQFGVDLVRNDPFLRNRPVVLHLPSLDEAQVREVCAGNRVATFDTAAARAAGIAPRRRRDEARIAAVARLRSVMDEMNCGAPLRPVG